MKLKYIIIDDCSAVLFGSTLTHKDVSQAARGFPVTGAGFCDVDTSDALNVKVFVFGKSVSLRDMEAKDSDAIHIKRIFEP